LVRTLEQRQGLRIGCLEEVAFRQGWIDRAQLAALGRTQAKSEYGQYLSLLAERPMGADEPAE
jgi:glucose-1-phosphate thymidylyltransferase